MWLYVGLQPVSTSKTYTNFVIDKGATATKIASDLQSAGLIRNALVFRIYLRATGQGSKIQTGEFKLSPSFNVFQTVSALQSGPIEIWVTIPEGFRREEVAEKFAAAFGKDQAFVTEFLDLTQGSEGMLFPDTYLFPKDVSAKAVVTKMASNFNIKTKDLKASGNLNFQQGLILASLIERETITDAERPVVAGILMNRLNLGMPLQVDASVQYVVANIMCAKNIENCKWWEPPLLGDLEIKSPFNTYKNTGLPPAPIASPGLSSLKAALNPDQNDYLYYIHDGSGQIHYAKTLEEQNANVHRYLGR